MTHATIAFIGLGHMGGPMAANLVKAGYTVPRLRPRARRPRRGRGAGVDRRRRPPRPPRGRRRDHDAARRAARLGAYARRSRLIGRGGPGTLFIDCSTIDVADARAAHELAVDGRAPVLDAPVSGGVVGAEAATLAFMVGGADGGLRGRAGRAGRDGQAGRALRGPGAGQAAKICNNMILGVSMIAVSEAFVLGEKLGLTTRRCSTSPPTPRASAGRSPPTARCPARCRPARPTATTRPGSPAR